MQHEQKYSIHSVRLLGVDVLIHPDPEGSPVHTLTFAIGDNYALTFAISGSLDELFSMFDQICQRLEMLKILRKSDVRPIEGKFTTKKD